MDKCFYTPADVSGRAIMEKTVLGEYPSVHKCKIAKSILGVPINAYIIGEGSRYVAFFGAHHASESITCNLLFTFIYEFMRGVSKGREKECQLFRDFRYVIVPAVNPDGIEIAMHGAGESVIRERILRMLSLSESVWQANARGVDLNHNYPYRFYEYKALEKERGITAGATRYSGEYPESEPETKAVLGLVRTLSPIGILSLHSQGEEIFHIGGDRLSRIAERLSGICGYTPSSPSSLASYGGLCDYTSSIGIPSFTIEVGRGENPLPLSMLDRLKNRLYMAFLSFPTML